MLSHIHLGLTDFQRAFAFYERLMGQLGFVLRFCEPDRSWAGWMKPGAEQPLLLIGRPIDGEAASAGNGQMVALLARHRDVVKRCHEAALAAGGTDEGAPGLRPHYHPDFYGAYFRDPDGNKLCVCCHDPVVAARQIRIRPEGGAQPESPALHDTGDPRSEP